MKESAARRLVKWLRATDAEGSERLPNRPMQRAAFRQPMIGNAVGRLQRRSDDT